MRNLIATMLFLCCAFSWSSSVVSSSSRAGAVAAHVVIGSSASAKLVLAVRQHKAPARVTAASNAQLGDSKSDGSRITADWVSAIFTTVAAVFTGLSILVFHWQGQQMKRQSDAIEAQLIIANDQINIAKRQIDLAVAEFNAAHRPKVIARRITVNFNTWGTFGVGLSVVNSGDTQAKSVVCILRLCLQNNSGRMRSYDMTLSTPPPTDGIPSGGWCELNASHIISGISPTSFPPESSQMVNIILAALRSVNDFNGADIYLIGDIVYEDQNNVKRRSAFKMKYENLGWHSTGNPEDNYAD